MADHDDAPRRCRSEPSKTLFVLPSLMRGGAETQLINLVNGLDPERFEKHLFIIERQIDQINRIDRTQVNFHHRARRNKFDFSPALEIARLIDQEGIGIIHCSLQIALLFGWLALRFSRRQPSLIAALHTTQNRDLKHELYDRLMYQWLLRSCDQVICVCETQRSHWLSKYPFLKGKTAVVYNGVDPLFFNRQAMENAGRDLRNRLGIPDNAFVASCIAGIRPEKGHSVLITAFASVINACPEAYLLLVGDGILRDEVERLVRKKGLATQVLFLGNLSDVRPALAASHCSIIASAVETFSMAMLESLAMELPVVATDIGGTGEVVKENETGYLVRSNDVDGLAEAIIRMVSQPERRAAMGKRGREVVESQFTNQNMVRHTAELLSTVACSDKFDNKKRTTRCL
jgi:glycosyltransferase involved in cell wall biosynthesis